MISKPSPHWHAQARPHFYVVHIVSNPRTAFWFFRSLHKQHQALFTLTTLSTLAQANAHLQHQHADVVFLHLEPATAYSTADIAMVKQWSSAITVIAVLPNIEPLAEPHTLDATTNTLQANTPFEEAIDDYLNASDITTSLLPRLVSYAVERKQSHLRLQNISQLDALTGLINHSQFIYLLQQQLLTPLSTHHLAAVFFLDLDHFKQVNETHGHTTGDKFLRYVAKRLKHAMRQSDVIARIGGDEFLILLRDMPNLESIERVANNLLDTLAQAVHIDGTTLFATASIGVAIHNRKDQDAEALLKHADVAMHSAKQQGGNRFAFFTRDQQVTVSLRASLEIELHKAIRDDDFFLTFQPQMNAQTNSLYGAEVLLRWQHPIHGELSPNTFVPTLESTGLIIPISEWVIQQAIGQWQTFLTAGTISAEANLSINLSPRFLKHPDFKKMLKEIAHLPSSLKEHIHFEITENLFVDPESNISHLNFIKTCGFKLAMDDFGTGYSSLSYLKHFPLDCIKLDCAFTKNITTNPIDCAITQAVIHLSRDLHIDLIAEGVEDAATLEKLKSMGCQYIQGYYYAKPLKQKDFQDYCAQLKNC